MDLLINMDHISAIRARMASVLSGLDAPGRDLNKECGYPNIITTDQYREMFEREGIGARVVSLLPEECWAFCPEIYEDENEEDDTEFELAWKNLNKRLNVIALLERADVISGIGRFGVMLLGFDDGGDLRDPLPGWENGEPEREDDGTPKAPNNQAARKLLYIRVFDETLVNVQRYCSDTTSPRYGLPEMYQINFTDSRSLEGGNSAGVGQDLTRKTVHWSRIIHLADCKITSEVFGAPRQQKVFNRLLDLRKVCGGSSEMFWKGGFPGYSFEMTPQALENGAELGEEERKRLRIEYENYANGLSRYIATVGVAAKTLGVQIADPTPQVEIGIRSICITLGIPWRIFMGAEAAQLASEQDKETFANRIQHRQDRYVTPMIIRPFVDRLIMTGAIVAPAEPYCVEWPEYNKQSAASKAEIAAKLTQAMAAYVNSGCDALMPPLQFLITILGVDREVAQEIVDAAMEHVTAIDNEEVVPGRSPPPPPTEVTVGPDGKPVQMVPGKPKPDPKAAPKKKPKKAKAK